MLLLAKLICTKIRIILIHILEKASLWSLVGTDWWNIFICTMLHKCIALGWQITSLTTRRTHLNSKWNPCHSNKMLKIMRTSWACRLEFRISIDRCTFSKDYISPSFPFASMFRFFVHFACLKYEYNSDITPCISTLWRKPHFLQVLVIMGRSLMTIKNTVPFHSIQESRVDIEIAWLPSVNINITDNACWWFSLHIPKTFQAISICNCRGLEGITQDWSPVKKNSV